MRLTEGQIEAIKTLTAACFGDDAEVYLFGSRTDDTRRGGDIDLYIKVPQSDPAATLDAKLSFLAQLKQRIGDQRIDLVVGNPQHDRAPPPIITIAQRTGLRL